MTRFSETTGGAIMEADGDGRGPRVYFDVDDINAATARVGELGGESGEAMPVPGMGWFSINKDTEGNEFGLWQNDETRRRRASRPFRDERGASGSPLTLSRGREHD